MAAEQMLRVDYLIPVQTPHIGEILLHFGDNGRRFGFGKPMSPEDSGIVNLLGEQESHSDKLYSIVPERVVHVRPGQTLEVGGQERSLAELVEKAYLRNVELSDVLRHDKLRPFRTLPTVAVGLSAVTGALIVLTPLLTLAFQKPAFGVASSLAVLGMGAVAAYSFRTMLKQEDANNRALAEYRAEHFAVRTLIDDLRVGVLRTGVREGLFLPGYGIN